MKVSVAMATFNAAEFLQAQLDSLLAQTRQPDELVVSDDCSTDATMDVLRTFAQSAPFEVRFHRNDSRRGIAQNFSIALSLSRGDLVFLCDQDDVWFPTKLAYIEELMSAQEGAWVIMNDASITDGNLVPTGTTKLTQLRAMGYPDASFVMGCCAAIRRDLLDLCLPVPLDCVSHDDWIIGIACGLRRRVIAPVVLQYYRRHGANSSKGRYNQTAPIAFWQLARLRRLLEAARAVVSSDRESPPNAYGALETSMLRWTAEVSHRIPTSCVADLEEWAMQLRAFLVSMDARMSARELPMWRRLIATWKLWRSGTYSKFSGLRSAVRDVKGK